MNFRTTFSIILIFLGILVALLPEQDNHAGHLKPRTLANFIGNTDMFITVDQVARMVLDEDSTMLLIDVRTPEAYRNMNIPGSVNIPLQQILNPDYEGYLNQPNTKNIFYSNGDMFALEAWMLATRVGYVNNFVMGGGLNEWYQTIMLSEFSGDQISPKENATFELRYKARKFFNQMNSLPDSLKTGFLLAKKSKERELVGGCE